MDNEERLLLEKDVDDAACSIRGNIIQRCTELELLIDSYIIQHFCGTDEN